MSFDQIIGHSRSINLLQKSIENNSISHSYLFEGEDGIGKKLVAKIFAKTLLCKEGQTTPCNKCSSCRKIDNDSHPDLIIISPEKGMIRKPQIDEMIKNATKLPFESERKIFIIDDSHTMNIESKNAILKTLEEPASFINIILISSNPDNLLPTILSRVESIKFFPIKIDEIENYLTNNYKLDDNKAKFIARFTKGAIGKCITIAEDESFFENREEVIDIIVGLINGDLSKAFSSNDFFEENKENINEILDIFTYFFRDILIYKNLQNTDLIVNVDKEDILSQARFMEDIKINEVIQSIEETKINIKRNINFQLAIEVMLLNIGGK